VEVQIGCGLQRPASPPARVEDVCVGPWCLVASVEEMVPGALRVLGPCKFLFASAATTDLWESGKEELIWEKMANLLRGGKLRAGETTSSVEEEEAAGPEDMVHAEVKGDPKSLA